MARPSKCIPEGWIDGTEVRRILTLTPNQLTRLTRSGRITLRQIPGQLTLYLEADVKAMAELAVIPAIAG